VNLTVIQHVLQRSLRAGLWVAIGGCLPELLYAIAAISAGHFLDEFPIVKTILAWATIPVLFIIGIVFIRSKAPTTTQVPQKRTSFFGQGVLMGLLNPQLFPYWLVILIQLSAYESLRVVSFEDQVAFVTGAAVGALGLLCMVAYLTARFEKTLLSKLQRFPVNQVLGVLFCLLGLVQLIKNCLPFV